MKNMMQVEAGMLIIEDIEINIITKPITIDKIEIFIIGAEIVFL